MKPLLIIAGCGQTGRELARRLLLSNWQVGVIDTNPDKLAMLDREVGHEVARVQGDATSTLVLKAAGVEQAQAVIATTNRDEVNLELCLLARDHFGIEQVLSQVRTRTRIADFEKAGITMVSRSFSVASQLESRLERGRRTTADVGLGQGELYEVTVLAHSPVIGKALASLRPQSWLVAAIYREGKLLVPHGKTVLAARDRVLLVGEPHILPAIVDYFRSGESEFPLHYGSYTGYMWQEGGWLLPEAVHLTTHSKARGLNLLQVGGEQTEAARAAATAASVDCRVQPDGCELVGQLEDTDTGCLVLPVSSPGWRDQLGLGHNRLMRLLDLVRQPVLLARGTFPYRKILLAVSSGPGQGRANELALDVARMFDASLAAVTCLAPSFVVGEERVKELRESLHSAAQLGSLYRMEVTAETLEGNPVHQIIARARHSDLLVLTHRRQRAFSPVRPDVSRHLITRSPCSVLVLAHGN